MISMSRFSFVLLVGFMSIAGDGLAQLDNSMEESHMQAVLVKLARAAGVEAPSEEESKKILGSFQIINETNQRSNTLWCLLSALPMGGKKYVDLYAKIVQSGYERNNSIIGSIGYAWSSTTTLNNEEESLYRKGLNLLSATGEVFRDACSQLAKYLGSWKAPDDLEKKKDEFGSYYKWYEAEVTGVEDPIVRIVSSVPDAEKDELRAKLKEFSSKHPDFADAVPEMIRLGSAIVAMAKGKTWEAFRDEVLGLRLSAEDIRRIAYGEPMEKTKQRILSGFNSKKRIVSFQGGVKTGKSTFESALKKYLARGSLTEEDLLHAMGPKQPEHTNTVNVQERGEMFFVDCPGMGGTNVLGVQDCGREYDEKQSRFVQGLKPAYVYVVNQFNARDRDLLDRFQKSSGYKRIFVLHNIRHMSGNEVEEYKKKLSTIFVNTKLPSDLERWDVQGEEAAAIQHFVCENMKNDNAFDQYNKLFKYIKDHLYSQASSNDTVEQLVRQASRAACKYNDLGNAYKGGLIYNDCSFRDEELSQEAAVMVVDSPNQRRWKLETRGAKGENKADGRVRFASNGSRIVCDVLWADEAFAKEQGFAPAGRAHFELALPEDWAHSPEALEAIARDLNSKSHTWGNGYIEVTLDKPSAVRAKTVPTFSKEDIRSMMASQNESFNHVGEVHVSMPAGKFETLVSQDGGASVGGAHALLESKVAEAVALVGPSGAGKTTLLNLLAGKGIGVVGNTTHTQGVRCNVFGGDSDKNDRVLVLDTAGELSGAMQSEDSFEFKFRVDKLIDTLKAWEKKEPKEYQAFITFLGLDPDAKIDQSALIHALQAFMQLESIKESPKDINAVIELFNKERDGSALFKPLPFYERQLKDGDQDVLNKQAFISVMATSVGFEMQVVHQFDEFTHQSLKSRSANGKRIVVVHNVSRFGEAYSRYYIDNFCKRTKALKGQVIEGKAVEGKVIKDEKGFVVCQDPSGIMHVFLKDTKTSSGKGWNDKTVTFLRNLIKKLSPNQETVASVLNKRTVASVLSKSMEQAVREAFFVSPTDEISARIADSKIAVKGAEKATPIPASVQGYALGSNAWKGVRKDTDKVFKISFQDDEGVNTEIDFNQKSVILEAPFSQGSTHQLVQLVGKDCVLVMYPDETVSGVSQECSREIKGLKPSEMRDSIHAFYVVREDSNTRTSIGNLPEGYSVVRGSLAARKSILVDLLKQAAGAGALLGELGFKSIEELNNAEEVRFAHRLKAAVLSNKVTGSSDEVERLIARYFPVILRDYLNKVNQLDELCIQMQVDVLPKFLLVDIYNLYNSTGADKNELQSDKGFLSFTYLCGENKKLFPI